MCPEDSGFLGFPNWYRGLQCQAANDNRGTEVVFTGINDTWLIVANVVDILIRIAGLLAVLFIIYGGIRYIISQGQPENIQAAKRTLTNAVIGLALAILASTIVGFIASRF